MLPSAKAIEVLRKATKQHVRQMLDVAKGSVEVTVPTNTKGDLDAGRCSQYDDQSRVLRRQAYGTLLHSCHGYAQALTQGSTTKLS